MENIARDLMDTVDRNELLEGRQKTILDATLNRKDSRDETFEPSAHTHHTPKCNPLHLMKKVILTLANTINGVGSLRSALGL